MDLRNGRRLEAGRGSESYRILMGIIVFARLYVVRCLKLSRTISTV